jgi:hypothetical protein
VTDKSYLVSVLAGEWDDELAGAVNSAGFGHTGGHSSRGTVGEGGELPPIDVHTLVVTAESEEAAREQVKSVLDSISRPHSIERVEATSG